MRLLPTFVLIANGKKSPDLGWMKKSAVVAAPYRADFSYLAW